MRRSSSAARRGPDPDSHPSGRAPGVLYLQNYEQAYGREIAAAFNISNSQVQKQLLKLESGGLLASQLVGRTRLYQWNPRNPLVPPFRALLEVALDSLPAAEQQRFFRKRTRPRRSGKVL